MQYFLEKVLAWSELIPSFVSTKVSMLTITFNDGSIIVLSVSLITSPFTIFTSYKESWKNSVKLRTTLQPPFRRHHPQP